jgi:hypothetical protein
MVETVSGFNAPAPADPSLVSKRLCAPRKASRVSATSVTTLPPAVTASVAARVAQPAAEAAATAGKRAIVYSHDLLSVVTAARRQCKLPYLNGAALVVYGLPVRFELAVTAK